MNAKMFFAAVRSFLITFYCNAHTQERERDNRVVDVKLLAIFGSSQEIRSECNPSIRAAGEAYSDPSAESLAE